MCSLGLALALAVSPASAGEIQWRAASDARPDTPPARGPAVTMLAPVPLPAAPTPNGVRPASFDGTGPDSRIVFRAQMGDTPRMLPVGKPEGPNDPPKKSTDALPEPRILPGAAPAFGDCGPGLCPPCPPTCCAPSACCGAGGCDLFCPNDCTGVPCNRLWLSAEALLWWTKGQRLPPLVTTGSPTADIPGALFQPGTVVLFGNSDSAESPRGGGRFRAGWWFDDDHTIGIDGSFFVLAERSSDFIGGSGGTPPLFRPFVNTGFTFVPWTGFVAAAPFENAEAVAFPGALAGAVNVHQTSRLWGYEANLRSNLDNGCCWGCNYTLDGYAGFRSIGLDDNLQITESLNSLIATAPGTIMVQDRFATRNRFYGGQVGLDGEFRWCRWFLDLNGRVALGGVNQVVDIQGATRVSDPTGVTVSQGGLLTQRSNIGTYSRDRFAVAPEMTLNFGYQVTDCLRLFVGYNFLYVSSVVRPGEQIDRAVNPTQIPRLGGTGLMGPANPAFSFRGNDFYAHGVNFGLEFRW
jgi:hypothetical protein